MFIKKISPEFQETLETLNIHQPVGSQKKWISRVKSGMDLIAVGPENSGKTTAYSIALIQSLKKAVADVPRAMVVCKDKESVFAIKEQFDALGKHTDLRFHIGFEGADIQKQKDTIYFGTDVVIGSAKRITELMTIEGINFAEIKTLIIDNAETVMKNTDMTFLHRITSSLPNAQKAIFTTSLSENIDRYNKKYMRHPEQIESNEIIPEENEES
ncbi:MAG: DEAD/DEAH box helicase [Schleiferiaceae bacterium]|jgi:superfamily II DNA/RNA helicase|nr:DEAD/DEAH box helicase [Schleiferiaceae bacterium]